MLLPLDTRLAEASNPDHVSLEDSIPLATVRFDAARP
jgi:hypothetical protein